MKKSFDRCKDGKIQALIVSVNEPDYFCQVKCRIVDLLIPKSQSVNVSCRAITGPIYRTIPVIFEPIDNSALPL